MRLRELPPTAGLPLRFADLWGDAQADLAAAVAGWLGCGPLLLTSSGSAALVIALTALRESSARREVVVPAYTCPLVAIAIAQAGLLPVPCDTLPGSFELDPADLARVLGPDTLAVLPTHLGGRVAAMATVLSLARAAGAFVIEDAAQALGARLGPDCGGVPAGTLADAGFFSLAIGKGLTTFEGGLLHARDPALARAFVRVAGRLAPPDRWLEALRSLQLAASALLYRPAGLTLAYGRPLRQALRVGDLVGAVGDRFASRVPLHAMGRWRQAAAVAALPRLAAHQQACAAVAATLQARLEGLGGAQLLQDPPGAVGIWPMAMILMPDAAARDAVLHRVWQGGIGASRLFIHALPDYPELAGLVPPRPVPEARRFAARLLTVGTSPWLRLAEIAALAGALAAASDSAIDDEEAQEELRPRTAATADQR